jgi:hypothetical protein
MMRLQIRLNSGVSIISTSVFVAKERQPGSPFGLGQKQTKKAQKIKKYGANAPQLHAIRCSIEFCVMQCNEPAFNPVQAWLSGFAAMCRSTTTVGTASIHHAQATC